jgi:hypothetical protein
MIFPVVESVILQGYLQFPQVFWMVFCGEFVVVGGGIVVVCRHDFWWAKFSSVSGFIFGWVREGQRQ